MTTSNENAAASTETKPVNIPITLTMNFEKVNYLLGLLGTCPYEKSFMVIHDIQAMASPQVEAFNNAQKEAEQPS